MHRFLVTRERALVECNGNFASGVEGPLHPRAHVRHVIAREIDAAVRLPQRDERFVRGRRFGPPGAAALWHARPRHRESRLELRCVLRMDPRTLLEREALSFRRSTVAHRPAKIEAVSD